MVLWARPLIEAAVVRGADTTRGTGNFKVRSYMLRLA